MGYEEYLKDHICPKCHLVIMRPHEIKYLKCTICAFTKEIKLKVNEVNKITGNVDGRTKKS